eukprot:scaffold2044_cov144-Skeletonema_menzelii.AAC.5
MGVSRHNPTPFLKFYFEASTHIFALYILIRVFVDIAIVRKLFSFRKARSRQRGGGASRRVASASVQLKSKPRNGSILSDRKKIIPTLWLRRILIGDIITES